MLPCCRSPSPREPYDSHGKREAEAIGECVKANYFLFVSAAPRTEPCHQNARHQWREEEIYQAQPVGGNEKSRKRPKAYGSGQGAKHEVANGGKPRVKRLGAPKRLLHAVANQLDDEFAGSLKQQLAEKLKYPSRDLDKNFDDYFHGSLNGKARSLVMDFVFLLETAFFHGAEPIDKGRNSEESGSDLPHLDERLWSPSSADASFSIKHPAPLIVGKPDMLVI